MTSVKLAKRKGRGVVTIWGPTPDRIVRAAQSAGPLAWMGLEVALTQIAESVEAVVKLAENLDLRRAHPRSNRPAGRIRAPRRPWRPDRA
jgi:hypothetical protein